MRRVIVVSLVVLGLVVGSAVPAAGSGRPSESQSESGARIAIGREQTLATAYASAVTTRCPSGDVNYYYSRGWTVCGFTVPSQWARSLYLCTIGGGTLSSLPRWVPWYSTWNIRACQDSYLVAKGNMGPNERLYYIVDLYKIASNVATYAPYVSSLVNTYLYLFWLAGTGAEYFWYVSEIPACGSAAGVAVAVTGATGVAGAFVGWAGAAACHKAYWYMITGQL